MERACLYTGLIGYTLLLLAIGDGHRMPPPWPLLAGLAFAATALYGGLALRLQQLVIHVYQLGRRDARGDDPERAISRIRP